MLRFPGAGRACLRPGARRFVRHPRGRQHRRSLPDRQRGVRRRTVRHASRCRTRPLTVRRRACHAGRADAPDRKAVAKSRVDRQPHPAISGSVADDRSEARFGGARRRGGSQQRPRVGGPSAARIGNPRAADRNQRTSRGGRGVFAGHRDRRFLRRRAGGRVDQHENEKGKTKNEYYRWCPASAGPREDAKSIAVAISTRFGSHAPSGGTR